MKTGWYSSNAKTGNYKKYRKLTLAKLKAKWVKKIDSSIIISKTLLKCKNYIDDELIPLCYPWGSAFTQKEVMESMFRIFRTLLLSKS